MWKIFSKKRKTYEDENGYLRYKDNNLLVHRNIAYQGIYLKNRNKYPLQFSQYQIHHKNQDKQDNNLENLEIVTRTQHERIHWVDIEGRLIKILFILLFFTWWLPFLFGIIIIIIIIYLFYKRYKKGKTMKD